MWRKDCEPIRKFERVTVTRIEALTGAGEVDNPYRIVTVWLEDDGDLIAYRDSWREEQITNREQAA